jgi:hypothetical protein
MKTTLITVSVAAVALWIGFAFGYHRGERDTNARWRSDYVITEITTHSGHAVNRAPETVTSNTNISR